MENTLSKYKFEVILEQITPYVNDFSISDDSKKSNSKVELETRNEIIRTTEFKPRLDKFLVRKLKLQHDSKLLLSREERKTQDEEKVKALDYKVIIEKMDNVEIKNYSDRIPLKNFQTSGTKYFVRKEGVKFKMIFFSLKPKVIEIIRENLAEFLALTNFGKRKNKCYGSFYIAKEDHSYKDIDEIEILKKFKFFNKENPNYIEMSTKEKKDNFFEKLSIPLEIPRKNNQGKQPIILLRGREYRKESLAIMKILKKGDRYRLYAIPNFPVIEALGEKLILSKCINKSKDFNIKAFDEYIKGYVKGR